MCITLLTTRGQCLYIGTASNAPLSGTDTAGFTSQSARPNGAGHYSYARRAVKQWPHRIIVRCAGLRYLAVVTRGRYSIHSTSEIRQGGLSHRWLLSQTIYA